MNTDERARVETLVRTHVEAGRADDAADVLIRKMGPELLGFLVATTRDEGLASDAFSLFCEDAWKGLPKFRFESSLRTWCYTLARNAASRAARSPRRKREVPGDGESAMEKLANHVRSSTMQFMKTETKDHVRKLRESLEPDDQTLLVLRVDKKLEWDEIAHVMADLEDGQEPDAALVKKKAAALRKRFERVKEKLRELAVKDGLIASRA